MRVKSRIDLYKLNHILNDQLGLIIGSLIVLIWCLSLWFSLPKHWSLKTPWPWLIMLLQTHLYTGLFITAHDAMHGIVSSNKKVNRAFGWICSLLFAYNWYPKLLRMHMLHHKYPVTEDDPDFHPSGFLRWYLDFALHYVTIWQILIMAGTYNLLILVLPKQSVIMFWMLPSILSTFQLFFFGTYLPHRGEHDSGNIHKARSQSNNHLVAFITCYFFGYHLEHHSFIKTPWWLLYKRKEEMLKKSNPN